MLILKNGEVLKKRQYQMKTPIFKEANISFAFPPPSSSYSVFGKNTLITIMSLLKLEKQLVLQFSAEKYL